MKISIEKNQQSASSRRPQPAVEVIQRAVPKTVPVGPCPICGNDESHILFRAKDRLHGTPGEYTYKRCKSCRTVFQDPRVKPEDLRLCYPADYYTHLHSDTCHSTRTNAHRERHFGKARDTVRRWTQNATVGIPMLGIAGVVGRILSSSPALRERAFYNYVPDALIPRSAARLRALDVGCGSGSLLDALQRVGWDAEGVEWDPVAADEARRFSGRPVWTGDFRILGLPLGSYHLIVLSHVFEHLDEPIGALVLLWELLAAGGRIVLFYPNPESLGSWLLGSYWFPWEPPRHLVLPSTNALRMAARRAGFDGIWVRTTAGHADSFFAYSRALREGKEVDFLNASAGLLDRSIMLFERILCGFGLGIGEEIIAILQKGFSRN